MIVPIIMLILLFYGIKGVMMLYVLYACEQKMNEIVNFIYDSKTDERLKQDFLIELNKQDHIADSRIIFSQFLLPHKAVNSRKWFNPQFMDFLDEEYDLAIKSNETYN